MKKIILVGFKNGKEIKISNEEKEFDFLQEHLKDIEHSWLYCYAHDGKLTLIKMEDVSYLIEMEETINE